MNILRAVPRRLALSDSFSPRLFHTTHRSLTNRRPLHEEGPDAEDGHQKSRPTAVMNQTFPEVAPTSDTIVPASMFSAFRNMFEQHSAVGIDVITQDGFVLTDNVQTRGPLVVLNGEAFLWDVQQGKAGSVDAGPFEGWDVDVLKVFEVVDPKPEIVIFGTGKAFALVPPKLREYLHGLGIQVDQMDTKNASSTFNVLTEEGRRVAAALLPLQPTSARTGEPTAR